MPSADKAHTQRRQRQTVSLLRCVVIAARQLTAEEVIIVYLLHVIKR